MQGTQRDGCVAATASRGADFEQLFRPQQQMSAYNCTGRGITEIVHVMRPPGPHEVLLLWQGTGAVWELSERRAASRGGGVTSKVQRKHFQFHSHLHIWDRVYLDVCPIFYSLLSH